MNFFFIFQKPNILKIQLRRGRRVIVEEELTVSHDFDNMLITTLDKLLGGINMNSTCVKSAEILGKVNKNAVWGMMLESIAHALRI